MFPRTIPKRSCAALLALALAGGCTVTKQARTAPPAGFLVDYARLRPGQGDQMLLRYVNPDADPRAYRKVLIDPFQIVVRGDLPKDAIDDLRLAAGEGYRYLREELGKDYELVDSPQPGTLRIQAALTDARRASPVRHIVSSVLPVGLAVSLAKDAVTGKPTGVGEAALEIRGLDAMTGEILAEAADRRVGGMSLKGATDSWAGVDEALRYWARRVRYVLCLGRSGPDCQAP